VLVLTTFFGTEEYLFVVSCEVLHATVSFENHDWQTSTTVARWFFMEVHFTFSSLVGCKAIFVLLVLHPRDELKEAHLFVREVMVLWNFCVASMLLKF
jgi:hypothetical protein